MVINGELSEGHGRALLGAPDELTMTHLADKAARGRLEVRQTGAARARRQAEGRRQEAGREGQERQRARS
ncbi:MAG: hypothetical protein R3B07_34190 [Polyangiaceae bacterium]